MEEIDSKFDDKKFIEGMAEIIVTAGICPLPDVTPLQRTINRLYVKLRICGMSSKAITIEINRILKKHNITKKQLLSIYNKKKL